MFDVCRDKRGGIRFRGDEKLAGRTVVVTGANSGMGKEIAKEFAKRGIHIYFLHFRLSVTASPAVTVEPRTLIFGMDIGLDGRLLIFCKLWSKVKVKKVGKYIFLSHF